MEIMENVDLVESVGDICDNQCRICLKKNTESCELFRNGTDIPKKLMAIAPVQVADGDGLPSQICVTCNQMIDICYDFQCQIQNSDEKLRQMLKHVSSKENDISSTIIVKEIITDVISTVVLSQKPTNEDCVTLEACSETQYSISPFVIEKTGMSIDNNSQAVSCYEKNSEAINKEEEISENSVDTINGNAPEAVQNCWPFETVENNTREEDESAGNYTNDVETERTYKSKDLCTVKLEENIADSGTNWEKSLRTENLHEETKATDDEEKPLIWRTSCFKCVYCMKSFHSKLALQRHVRVHKHKAMLRYVCHVCEKQYSSVANLKAHVTVAHDSQKSKTLKQNLKDRKVSKKLPSNYDAVPKVEKKNFKFICKVCNKQFTYQKSFLAHASTHTEYKHGSVESNKCEEKEEEKITADVEQQVTKQEDDVQECDDDNDQELPMQSLQCTQCRKLFATKRNLQRHISTHSGLKYNCATCGKGFSRIDKLKDHEQSKHKVEIFENSDTDEKQDSDNMKESHMAERRKKEKYSRPHKCAICPKSFAQAQSLANHMERHKRVKETQKRFLCEVCSKCFAQSGSLVAHMRTHTGVKPYVCNVCNRAFTKSTYLQLHMRTHSGEKPYICQYCSRAFARANTLARHITMHTGEAKYHCQICTKSFRRLTSLNEHTYTHTGQRPYACKICTKRYNNAGSLYAHRKKCKAQQLVGTGFTVSVENSAQQSEVNVPQVLIYSQRKLMEETVLPGVTPPSQYMLNTQNQKNISANVIQPFAMEDPNLYSVSSKQFKNPYYTIYPNM